MTQQQPPTPDAPEPSQAGGVNASESSKKPLESKKWTALMWIHTTLVAFLFFVEWREASTNLVTLSALAILGGIDVLYLGGVYALDRYRIGLTDVVRAVKGEPKEEGELFEVPEDLKAKPAKRKG